MVPGSRADGPALELAERVLGLDFRAFKAQPVPVFEQGDEAAAELAFADGWFHPGDLRVMQPDSYIQIKERAKDIIISGGGNIWTIEAEQALATPPEALDVAVIGVPDGTGGAAPRRLHDPRKRFQAGGAGAHRPCAHPACRVQGPQNDPTLARSAMYLDRQGAKEGAKGRAAAKFIALGTSGPLPLTWSQPDLSKGQPGRPRNRPSFWLKSLGIAIPQVAGRAPSMR